MAEKFDLTKITPFYRLAGFIMRRLAIIAVFVVLLVSPSVKNGVAFVDSNITAVETDMAIENNEEIQLVKVAPSKIKFAYQNIIVAAADTYNLPADLIAAIIKVESGFNPRAVSNKGAIGLMQITRPTGRILKLRNPFNPVQNILAGARYLRQLLDRFNGDVHLAVASYNAGPGAVERHGGIPPYRQTRRYVPKVMDYYNQYQSGIAVD